MKHSLPSLLLIVIACASARPSPRPVFDYVLAKECEREGYGASNRWHDCDLQRTAKALVESAVNGPGTERIFSGTDGRVFIAPAVNKTTHQIDGKPFAAVLERGLLESRRGTPVADRVDADVVAWIRIEGERSSDGTAAYSTTLTLERRGSEERWTSRFEVAKAPKPRNQPDTD